ncbi:LysE family transporter [bacterium]|nr:LysE family transporter [bacterium]
MNPATSQKTLEQTGLRRIGRLGFLAFLTGFSGAMMPGPLLVAVIEQTALQRSLWAPFWLLTGHALLELIILFFLILGLQAVIARPRVRGAIGVIGGAALVYMGADMLRHVWGLSLNLEASPHGAYAWPRLILLGAAVCAANPYFTGWWATIGAGQLAHMAPKTAPEYLAFYAGHETSDYTWYLFVGILLISGRHLLTDGVYRALIILCAAALILLGLRFLYVGAKFLARKPGPEPQTPNSK